MNIGEQIKKYRKEAGLSQKELGQKLGVSQQHIAQYENGKRIPKIETINNIAGALQIGVRRLYPDFSMEEWKKTDSYKKSSSEYEIMKQGIITMLSRNFKDLTEINIDSNVGYSYTCNGYMFVITHEDLYKLIEFYINIIPSALKLLDIKVIENDTDLPFGEPKTE